MLCFFTGCTGIEYGSALVLFASISEDDNVPVSHPPLENPLLIGTPFMPSPSPAAAYRCPIRQAGERERAVSGGGIPSTCFAIDAIERKEGRSSAEEDVL